MTEEHDETFEAVRDRLDEIVDEVNAEGVTLEEALSLYEEAVNLGLAACDLSEEDILEEAEVLSSETETSSTGSEALSPDVEMPSSPEADTSSDTPSDTE